MDIQQLLNPAPHPAPNTVVLRVPLPDDTDNDFSFPIKVSGRLGLQLVEAKCSSTDQILSPVILRIVDGASICLDNVIPGPWMIAHRAPFATKKDASMMASPAQYKRTVKTGFTIAHLLTFLLRKQYEGWSRNFEKMSAQAPAEVIVGRGNTSTPAALVSFKHLYVVAIRRSNGRDGQVRWFPQLEVRFP